MMAEQRELLRGLDGPSILGDGHGPATEAAGAVREPEEEARAGE
jgi:hypothetical protein